MRITNINTLSALIDRLITERIKHFFFTKEKNKKKIAHQIKVIAEIKLEISKLFEEVNENGEYQYLSEKRTFSINDITETIDSLTLNDIRIGESDRERLKEVNSDNPSLDNLVNSDKIMRKSNEGRANDKNRIDSVFQNFTEV